MAQEYRKVGTETRYRDELQIVEQDLGYEDIPVCRPKFVFFEFTGLKPNTPHWIFMDNKDVTKWVNTSFSLDDYNSSARSSLFRNPGDSYIDATQFPSGQGGPTAATGPIDTGADGTLSGVLYIQSNSSLSFPVGAKIITAIDVDKLDKVKALSYGQTEYVAHGLYELYYEEKFMATVAYEEDVYEWVTVPDPTPPASNNNNNDNGSSSNLIYSHYEPSSGTVTKWANGITWEDAMKQRSQSTTKKKDIFGNERGVFDKERDNGGEGSKQSSKIVCTAMNNAYGFGSYRQAIWLKYSEGMTKEHEVGYHAIFMPLVNKAYNSGEKNNMFIRKVLEHIARHRTADIRAETQGRKRDKIGRIERAILEPLCYIVGKIKMRKQ